VIERPSYFSLSELPPCLVPKGIYNLVPDCSCYSGAPLWWQWWLSSVLSFFSCSVSQDHWQHSSAWNWHWCWWNWNEKNLIVQLASSLVIVNQGSPICPIVCDLDPDLWPWTLWWSWPVNGFDLNFIAIMSLACGLDLPVWPWPSIAVAFTFL
jgi:hypothetical protein